MKRSLALLICAALCLVSVSTVSALTMDDVTEVITIDQLTPEQIKELMPWYVPTTTATPTPTPRPTPTPIPPHSFELDFLYCDFWYNPKDGLSYAKWEYKGNDLLFSVRVENLTEHMVIDAIDFVVYGENAYGETIYPDNSYSPYSYYTCDMRLKPGKNKYTSYLRLEGLRHAHAINIAITRYHIEDYFTVNCNDPAYSDARNAYRWYSWDID